MNWLMQAITDGRTNRVSSKRIAYLMATVVFSISTLALTYAACKGVPNLETHFIGVTGSLAALTGYGYVNGKSAERKYENGPVNPENMGNSKDNCP